MNQEHNSANIISPRHDSSPLPRAGRNFLRIASTVDGEDLTCVICGQQVDPAGFRCDNYNNVACLHHNITYCRFCHRIIHGPKVLVPHFGFCCYECAKPINFDELTKIAVFIIKFFKERGIYIPEFKMNLLPAEHMQQRYQNDFETVPLGVACKGNPHRIDLMSQQSKLGIAETLSHELLHLWQYHYNINAPYEYSEGFCNLGSYEVLLQIDRSEALVRLKTLMENPDPAYGVAFRELKVVHDVYGWDTVVKSLLKYSC